VWLAAGDGSKKMIAVGTDSRSGIRTFFSGVGSTILAAERVRRTCRAIEIDPLYVDTAVRRWEKQTGRQAVLAEKQ